MNTLSEKILESCDQQNYYNHKRDILFSESNYINKIYYDSNKLIYTIGYEGLSIKKFKKILYDYKIQQVIDVRNRAWSVNPTFRKGFLSKVLSNEGISYLNIRELGAPKQLRNIINENGYEQFFKAYRSYLLSNIKYFEILMDKIKSARTVILCYEKEWQKCHRRIIAEELIKRGYVVRHIG